MLKLYVIRHGKAEAFADKDYNRPLNQKGWKQSQYLNSVLTKYNPKKLDVLFSNALRTKETYEITFQGITHQATGSNEFYGADFMQWMNALQNNKVPNEIALIGHNPGVSRLVSYLCGTSLHMQTGSMASIRFELNDWSMIGRELGILEEIVRWNGDD